jgi:hypothetical protein
MARLFSLYLCLQISFCVIQSLLAAVGVMRAPEYKHVDATDGWRPSPLVAINNVSSTRYGLVENLDNGICYKQLVGGNTDTDYLVDFATNHNVRRYNKSKADVYQYLHS